MPKPAKKLLILSLISLAVALIVPGIWLLILNTKKPDTFVGMIPIWLVYPGYTIAAILFPDKAANETAGLALLPHSLLINFVFYFVITFLLLLLAMKIRSKIKSVKTSRSEGGSSRSG